ncbi:Holliday junction ATP-dependent DNA helicase ruvA [Syntrophobotulus glycolicus DSM 8271]|uniref:Holliday junction branch migration complex subunit RuvA n=1 Tax=Syntrophobotulus glycolicus (strain DSM 8271 / FlGlyR) TaxID=645991 RepID=F0T268_SYNGF|nr:Holliday junction branch migration protein RuvA [Syntrophobotulus glycolicus]ADY56412.1 Holliday junction ATP-dependent DNA helicase ruvA [Syntrophobotulus glycolicus DSM 8271]
MIALLRGTVWEMDKDKLIVDVNGVGYLLNVPSGKLSSVRIGQEVVLHTYLLVREDDLSLFGFADRQDKELFIKLLSVSGIGPKAALSILSSFSSVQIITALVQENHVMFTEISGIGSKIARRLTLELKEKFKDYHLEGLTGETFAGSESGPGSEPGIMEALLALGFTPGETRTAVNAVGKLEGLTFEEQLREALRLLARA